MKVTEEKELVSKTHRFRNGIYSLLNISKSNDMYATSVSYTKLQHFTAL